MYICLLPKIFSTNHQYLLRLTFKTPKIYSAHLCAAVTFESVSTRCAQSVYSQKHIFEIFAFHTFQTPAFSSPAFSTPAVWCRVFQSRVFSRPGADTTSPSRWPSAFTCGKCHFSLFCSFTRPKIADSHVDFFLPQSCVTYKFKKYFWPKCSKL